MSLEGKKDTDKWFPIILIDDTDFKTAEPGKVFGDVTCKYSYEAATSLTTYSVTTNDWKEAGEGKYWLRIGASEFTSEGKYEVSVTVAGCLVFNFCVEIRDKTINESMIDIEADITFLKDIEGGRWRIVGYQMIFYKSDNVTEVARFDLKDVNGDSAMKNVFERVRV